MSFDPTIPQANTNLDAVPIRDNFNALKTLIDAFPAGRLQSNNGETLTPSGSLLIILPTPVSMLIPCFQNGNGVGVLTVSLVTGTQWQVSSSAGAADNGATFGWIAF